MPKIIPKPKDKYKRLLISRLEYECNVRDITIEHQRVIARKSQGSYDARRKDPGKFTVDELLRFSEKLKIPIWELMKPDTAYMEVK